MELKDIKLDPHNYRKHTDKNKELIKRSLEECGFGRSILIDSEGCIIAGNGVFSQLPKNTKTKTIQTYGDELVIVQRMDLKTKDRKRKELAIWDNSTGDKVEWDYPLVQTDFNGSDLEYYGVPVFETSDLSDVESFFKNSDENKKKMPKKVVCPHCGKEFELE